MESELTLSISSAANKHKPQKSNSLEMDGGLLGISAHYLANTDIGARLGETWVFLTDCRIRL